MGNLKAVFLVCLFFLKIWVVNAVFVAAERTVVLMWWLDLDVWIELMNSSTVPPQTERSVKTWPCVLFVHL